VNIPFHQPPKRRVSSPKLFMATDVPLLFFFSRPIENTALDLESFASHAGRKTIKTDDVMLLARRNEGLEQVLRGFVEELMQKNEAAAAAAPTAKKKAGRMRQETEDD